MPGEDGEMQVREQFIKSLGASLDISQVGAHLSAKMDEFRELRKQDPTINSCWTSFWWEGVEYRMQLDVQNDPKHPSANVVNIPPIVKGGFN